MARETLGLEGLNGILEYQWFTDIEFNPNKSVNFQVEGVVLLKYILKYDCLDVLESKKKWLNFHKK